MNIELIIFLAVWFVSTEVIFFKYMRDQFLEFIPEKLLSILTGLLAAAVLFGLPWFISSLPTSLSTIVGPIAYAWYYGVILSISAFFLINYAIHKWLDRKKL